jgi:hypothetical protein
LKIKKRTFIKPRPVAEKTKAPSPLPPPPASPKETTTVAATAGEGAAVGVNGSQTSRENALPPAAATAAGDAVTAAAATAAGTGIGKAGKLIVELVPKNEATERCVRESGFNPKIQLTTKTSKSISSLLVHLTTKWKDAANSFGPSPYKFRGQFPPPLPSILACFRPSFNIPSVHPSFRPSFLSPFIVFFRPSSFIVSFLRRFLPSVRPSFLHRSLPSVLSPVLPFFHSSFLPSFLPSFSDSDRRQAPSRLVYIYMYI